MFTVKPEYWNCMGETVLKKTKFDEDSAVVRGMNRSLLDQQAQDTVRQSQLPPPPPPSLPVRMIATILNTMQQVVQTVVVRPAMAFAAVLMSLPQNAAQAAVQMAQNLGKMAERTIGQLISFFFGHKKDKTEEAEQRDKNDASLLDIFGDNPFSSSKISKKENAGLGSGSK